MWASLPVILSCRTCFAVTTNPDILFAPVA